MKAHDLNVASIAMNVTNPAWIQFRNSVRAVRILCTFLPIAIGIQVFSQQYSITAGTITACSGVLEDSGGPSGQYGDNENYTVVICPDIPGDGIFLTWAIWDLNTSGPNNNLDRIRIWDGNSTAGTYLGEYNTMPAGGVAAATTMNPSGCLTVQFISNGSGTGNFAATITCFTPCDRPTAVANMSEPGPALVCVGEEVDFDGTASYAASGFNITSYEWVFDDGTTANTPTATHSFSEPGEYMVQLNLIDDNECANSNVVDLQVLVSTTPSFNGTVESVESCLGASVDLSAVVTPTTWTGIPETNFGDGVYLPDSLGVPFNSDVVFTQFEPGQTVTSVNDILSVCVSMEHSFMGDLVLSLTCPNGQSITFHQQGGGGTFLGDANDTDWSAPVPGTCWDYCWSPTATLGTWEQSSQWGTSPNVMPSSQGTALVPDTYSSVQPFSNLVGCPLNGTWTYTSLDLWGADNGFLCSWSINFDPSIIPDVTQFTPVPGISITDSASWTGPDLVIDPNDPLSANAAPSSPGAYDYVFSVTDNFGCSYDTTITVTIAEPMQVEAGPDIILCNDPVPMAGEVVNAGPADCIWTLELYESWGDTWNGGATIAVTIDGVTNDYAITTSGTTLQTHNLSVTAGSSVTLQYTAGSIFNGENSFSLFDDLGNVVYASPTGPLSGVSWSGTASCGGSSIQAEFIWTPADGLDDPTDPLTNVFVTQPTWFYLSVFPPGSPECAVMDSVLVSPDPSLDAGENNALTVCANEPLFQLTDSLGGTPDAGGVWTLNGATVPEEFDPLSGTAGTYTYTVTSNAGCSATAELTIEIIPVDDPTCCGIADAGEDSYSCDLSINLYATPGNTGVGVWTGPAGAIFQDAESPETMVTMPAGSGGTHTFYWIEDDGAFCYLIDSVQKTFTDDIVIDITSINALCFSYCDGSAQATVIGGNAVNGFTYAWSGGTGSNTAAISDLCAGEYSLLVTDDNGCQDSASVTITEPILLEIDSLAHQPVTCSGDCDGQMEIYDGEAIEYSFNQGATWSADPISINSCEGIYPVQIRDAIGCIGTGVITVTGPPPVVADFEWGPDHVNVDNPRVQFDNTSENADTYDWDIAGLLQTTIQDPVFLFDEKEPANYEVCLIAYNFNQCSDTICHLVEIEDVLLTYVPNTFTPNGDDLNEEFKMSINIDVITSFSMTIFDRWGQVVFQTNDPYQGWNGGFGNSDEVLKSDVYAYRITFEVQETQARREYLGHVTLLK